MTRILYNGYTIFITKTHKYPINTVVYKNTIWSAGIENKQKAASSKHWSELVVLKSWTSYEA